MDGFIAGIGLTYVACNVSIKTFLTYFMFLMCCVALCNIFGDYSAENSAKRVTHNANVVSAPMDPTTLQGDIFGEFCPQNFAEIMNSISDESKLQCHYRAAPSYTLDDELGGYEYHIMDSGASVIQHKHESYVYKDARTKRINVTVANGMHMMNKSSGKSAYKDKNGTIVDTTSTTSYCMPDCNENLMSLIDMAKCGCTIVFSNKLPNYG